MGAWLAQRSRAPLRRLARSKSVWERRIAIVATQYFIRQRSLEDTFALADLLLADNHDLIHKAVGWMLREAGDRIRPLRAAFWPHGTRGCHGPCSGTPSRSFPRRNARDISPLELLDKDPSTCLQFVYPWRHV